MSTDSASSSLPDGTAASATTTGTRYACVGTGGRARMLLDPVATTYRDAAVIAGLCDSSLARARHHQVVLEYLLNTSHGADDFRRWHADKAESEIGYIRDRNVFRDGIRI